MIYWEFFINFLEVLFFYLFIHTRLILKDNCKHIYTKQFAFLFCQFILICVLNYIDLASIVTMSIICLLDIMFSLIFYNDTIIMRIFWGSVYSVICLLSDYLTLFVPQTFSKVTSNELLYGGALRMPFSLLYIVLIAGQVFLFQCISNKKLQLSLLQRISYILILITGILIGHYIIVVTLDAEAQFHNYSLTYKLVLINLAFLVLFLFLLTYIYQLGYSKTVNTELLEQKKLHELEEMEYKTLLHTTESLREMKHDIDIHLDVIQTLLANGNLSELKSYVESYHNSLSSTHHLLSTGNTAIDCVLSNKINLAKKLNIITEFSVLLPDNFPMDPLSLSSLLGNLWNNSLEACERLQKEKPDIQPFINFYIKPFQHMILVHIENNYGKIIQKNNEYISLKENNSHGLGLKRIRSLVSNANGVLKIDSEDNIFIVHIMIPQKGDTE